MPARIYALAKELNIDSKDLVDLVKKVGITGKGSALASLSDEEAQKVRDHLSSAGEACAASLRLGCRKVPFAMPFQRNASRSRSRWDAVRASDHRNAIPLRRVRPPLRLLQAGPAAIEPEIQKPVAEPSSGAVARSAR